MDREEIESTSRKGEGFFKGQGYEGGHDGVIIDEVRKTTMKYECDQCGKVFTTRENVRQHIFVMHVREYECPLCGKLFGTHFILTRHVGSHNRGKGDLVFENGKLKRTQDLKKYRHDDSGSYLKDSKCTLCDKTFTRQDSMKQHFLVVHSKYHKCEECGRLFGTVHLLKRHLYCHKNSKNYECKECGRKFAQARYLQQHTAVVHTKPGGNGESEEWEERQLEGKTSSDSSSKCVGENEMPKMGNSEDILKREKDEYEMDGEIRRLHEEGNHSGLHSGMHFKWRDDFLQHNYINSAIEYDENQCEDRMDKCELMQLDDKREPMQMNNQRPDDCHLNVRRHEKTSFKETLDLQDTYNSDIIKEIYEKLGKGFEQMIDHVMISTDPLGCEFVVEADHTEKGESGFVFEEGTRKYKCTQCGKRFYRERHIRQHVVFSHTEKQRCLTCGEFFQTKEMLDKHMKSHSLGKYKCDICGQCFHHRYLTDLHIIGHIEREK